VKEIEHERKGGRCTQLGGGGKACEGQKVNTAKEPNSIQRIGGKGEGQTKCLGKTGANNHSSNNMKRNPRKKLEIQWGGPAEGRGEKRKTKGGADSKHKEKVPGDPKWGGLTISKKVWWGGGGIQQSPPDGETEPMTENSLGDGGPTNTHEGDAVTPKEFLAPRVPV